MLANSFHVIMCVILRLESMHRVLFILCCFLFSAEIIAQSNIEVSYDFDQKTGDYKFTAINTSPSYMTIVVEFNKLVGLTCNTSLPAVKVVPPGRHRLFELEKSGSGNSDFNYKFYYWTGSANPKIDDVLYTFPVSSGLQVEVREVGSIKELVKGEEDEDFYALSFDLIDGDTITAVRRGVVEQIEQGNQTDTLTYTFTRSRNFMTVRHEDGTVARYMNFKNNSAQVEKGDEVLPGTALAVATQTSTVGHARLLLDITYLAIDTKVSRNYKDWAKVKSLIPKFVAEGFEGSLKSGETYTSVINDELITQEMSKREKKKYLGSK